jgi:hypothetical protein
MLSLSVDIYFGHIIHYIRCGTAVTVIQTYKAQGKSALDFFRQALIDPTELTLISSQT